MFENESAYRKTVVMDVRYRSAFVKFYIDFFLLVYYITEHVLNVFMSLLA